MNFVLDLSSVRASKARLQKSLSRRWLDVSLALTAFFSIGGGIYFLFSESQSGWVISLPGTLALMVLLWYKGDLNRQQVGNSMQSEQVLLHEVLAPNLLANLKKSEGLSAYELWQSLAGTEEHYFLQKRYLIDDKFFEQLLAREAGSANNVWTRAAGLQAKYQTPGYTNMLVLVALVLGIPDIEQRLNRIQLEPNDIETSIPWMRDIHAKRALARQQKYFGGIGRDWAYGYTPILSSLGHNISRGIEEHGFFIDAHVHEKVVEQMAQIINGSSAVTLVGDAGVGKRTSVLAFANRLLSDPSLPQSIRYNQIVELDASTLIANAKNAGQLEALILRLLSEAQRAKNIILFFDQAQAFFESGTGSVDLSHVLQPALESGAVRIIFAMTPQHWQKLSSSGAVSKLQPLNLNSAGEDDTLAVLRDEILELEYRHNIIFTYQALHESYKLAGRYVNNQSMPGAALTVLEQAATTTKQQLITRQVIQQAVEQTYNIKLQTAQGGESSDLLQLEDKIRKYVISQDRAVTVVANALRRSRSGVGNPDRPIGTFLFLGPTGVGKTELSKALARVYFGDEKALIRVDMNQYVKTDDVSRLIAPTAGEELSFLDQVRRQPFSVILLDEIEKAHPSVINALLQMLDEGIMRDSDNKKASFKDAIIIATSNAGADQIRQMIEQGKDLAELEATFIDQLISQGVFAPEFINRFDEVVLFKPLSPDDLVQVIDLIIEGINKTLDSQKVRVELSEAAKRWLIDKGYDSRLGARPMRRMAQRYVENIVAKRLLEHKLESGGSLRLDVADFESGSETRTPTPG